MARGPGHHRRTSRPLGGAGTHRRHRGEGLPRGQGRGQAPQEERPVAGKALSKVGGLLRPQGAGGGGGRNPRGRAEDLPRQAPAEQEGPDRPAGALPRGAQDALPLRRGRRADDCARAGPRHRRLGAFHRPRTGRGIRRTGTHRAPRRPGLGRRQLLPRGRDPGGAGTVRGRPGKGLRGPAAPRGAGRGHRLERAKRPDGRAAHRGRNVVGAPRAQHGGAGLPEALEPAPRRFARHRDLRHRQPLQRRGAGPLRPHPLRRGGRKGGARRRNRLPIPGKRGKTFFQ